MCITCYKIGPHIASMAQAQLEAVHFSLNDSEISCVYFQHNKREVTCLIDETVSLVVKKTKESTTVFLKDGNKRLKLSPDSFERLCELQHNVKLLISFIQGNFSSCD